MENVVGPDAARCQTSVSGQPTNVNADGGTVDVTITAARDCAWTASTESSWMQLSTTSGQGNASVNVAVARNELPSARTGALVVNNQRLTVSQEGRPCTFDLQASSSRMSSDGGRGSFGVTTAAGCSWTATTSASWIQVVSASANGPGTVQFDVAPNTGGPRDATITVGDRQHTVFQVGAGEPAPAPPLGPACIATVDPMSVNVPVGGGTASVSLTINGACDWTASTTDNWVTFTSPTTGRGNATIGLRAAPNQGPARAATVTIAEQVIVVAQPAAAATPTCTYSVAPSNRNVGAANGSSSFTISTSDGCAWTASENADWLSLSRTTGDRTTEVRYTFQANSATTARTATVTAQGRTHTVRQAGAEPSPPAACTFQLDSGSRNYPASGGNATIIVSAAPSGCAGTWSVSGAPEWVQVSGGSGSASGQFSYTVTPNPGTEQRRATLTVGGQQHQITQAGTPAPTPTCAFQLDSGSRNYPASGGNATVTITATPAGCAGTWSVSGAPEWVQVSGGSGSASGQFSYTVTPNPGTEQRSATLTVGGQQHQITQAGTPPPTPTCAFQLDSGSRNYPASGGNATITVTATPPGCAGTWSVSGAPEWVQVSGGSGSASGQFSYTVTPNPGTEQRTATLQVGGQQHQITQAGTPPPTPTCAFQLDSGSRNYPASGGNATVTVTATPPGCAGTWSVSGAPEWVQVSGGSGSASGQFSYTVTPNPGTEQRTATLTVGGQQHQITQAGTPPPTPTCAFRLDSGSRNYPASGGNATITVTATPPGCAGTWSVSGAPEWVQVSGGSGSASGQFSYTVTPNPGTEQRTATLTVGGQQHQITQAGTPPPTPTCTFQLDSGSRNYPASGGNATITVTASPAGCAGAWSVSGAPEWVQVSGGSGSASGQFSYTVTPNPGTEQRTATLQVGGQQHQITQAGTPPPTPTCAFQLDSGSRNYPASGGNATVTVTATPPGCAGTWSVSGAPEWVQVSGGSGSASGQFSYTVVPNAGTEQRTATLTVGGQQHQITQAGTPPPTPTCAFSVQPPNRQFPNSGGSGTLTITASAAECTWTASRGAAEWITLSRPSGTGSTDVGYTVAPNGATSARNATITAGGQPHVVTQDAAIAPQVCSYTIDPSRRRFEEEGGEGRVRVTTTPTCAWQATTAADWISIVNGSGTGPGEVLYRVARLTGDDDRRTTILIAGQTHEVEQREDDDLSSWDVAHYIAALSHPHLVPSRRVRV